MNILPEQAAHLFAPLQLGDIQLRIRTGVSPMCQYSNTDRLANRLKCSRGFFNSSEPKKFSGRQLAHAGRKASTAAPWKNRGTCGREKMAVDLCATPAAVFPG
jgi:2,4-dienoyl-CoA reductase-like NADH-dependent reductase (Old Yellow Enzyme family)